MLSKNVTKWKKKLITDRFNQFIEDFSLFIKQCYRIVWSVEKMEKVKIQIKQKMNERV